MPAKLLWSPTSPESTQMHKFKAKVSEKYGVELGKINSAWVEMPVLY